MEHVKTNGEVSKEFPQGKESYCPQCYFEDDKVVLRKDCKHNTPQLAEEGTLMARFQKDRTDAISRMFDRDIKCGTLHTTSKFFAELDLSVAYLLSQCDDCGHLRDVCCWEKKKCCICLKKSHKTK